MKRIVLLRHGESEWNKENRFTGWIDVDLSEKGIIEANNAGITLRKAGHHLRCCLYLLLEKGCQNTQLRSRPSR